ncbi:IclR family transcriptional regulator [Gordonia polyisoprenivorans]|uniref:IclR family transcriptional regulator n=1 Tax=Gordonia polyisoprenivorans TaxID=84595 RepID=UPI0003623C29|nr:IclR family transcriptional regulator [Gordonia polyisoprenivorans]
MPTKESNPSENPGSGAVQSVDRALQILELIGQHGAAGVTELAAELGVHKSTVSRVIGSLEARGFVEQEPGGRKYRIGFTVVRLASSTSATLDLSKQGQEICEMLAAELGETANIAVLGGTQAVNIVEAQGTSSVALHTWIGQTSPAHATSSGKTLLAALSDDEVRATFSAGLPGYTEHTITEIDALLADLALIRDRGWAIAEEELELGLVAVAAPIRDHSGAVIGALSVSGPRYRLDPDDAPALAATVQRAAVELNSRFGFRG